MARTAYSLNSYTGGAGAAYLTGSGIGATDTTITITGTTAGWVPLGTAGGWYLDIDYGTANEEKVFVASGTYAWSSGLVTISGITRGIDETTAVVHSGGGMPNGPVCTPVVTAIDTGEANQLVYDAWGGGSLTLSGNLTVTSGNGILVKTSSTGGPTQTLALVDANGGNGTAYFRAAISGTGFEQSGWQVVNSAFSAVTMNVSDQGNMILAGSITTSGVNFLQGTNTISGTNTIFGNTNVSGTMQGNSIYSAPTSIVSANHTAIYNEVTIYSGSTAAQTIFLPSGNLVNGCNNTVVNYGTVSITVASGSTAQLNNFGVLGNITLQQYQAFDFTYNAGNNTWYAEDSNAINASPLLEGTITISGTTNFITGPTNFGTTIVNSGVHTGPSISNAQNLGFLYSGINAAGTGPGTATAITTPYVCVSGATATTNGGAGTGVILPVPSSYGQQVVIDNSDATHWLIVYPSGTGSSIDGTTTSGIWINPNGHWWGVCEISGTAGNWSSAKPVFTVSGSNNPLTLTYGNGQISWNVSTSPVFTNATLSGTTVNVSGTTNNFYGTENFVSATTVNLGTTVVTSGIFTDITVSGNIVISGSTNPTYYMPPSYVSPYKAWTIDPMLATTQLTLVTGTAYYTAIWVPQPMTLSGISFYPNTFAATDTAYLAFFNATTQLATCSGVLGGTTNSLNKALISGGTYQITTPGLYYVGLVVSGSTSFITYAGPAGQATLINMGVGNQTNAVTGLRNGSVVIGQRALYGTGGTISGTVAGPNTPIFFALS